MAQPATPSSPDASAEATETSLSAEPREPLPPPERDGAERASTFAPDTPASGRRGEELSETKEKLPTRQQIERRAYEIYANRGGQSGNEMADWLAAEKELTSRYQRDSAGHWSLEVQLESLATRRLPDLYGLREHPFGI